MNQPKIVLDFTRPDLGQQEVAVMPAALAKRLLKMLTLEPATADDIIGDLRAKLKSIEGPNRVEQAVGVALDFAIERQLIDNVKAENWDAYKVEGFTQTR